MVSLKLSPSVRLCFVLGVLALAPRPAEGQTITPEFAGSYSLTSLGSAPGVPTLYGGLTFLNQNTLLLGGAANGPSGAVYAVPVTRGSDGHITGFGGSATLFASAPEIDGGLTFGPGGVLFYTGYAENLLGQIKPGSTGPDKVINLNGLGIAVSVGSLEFVPSGFPDAGEARLVSWSGGEFYSANLTPDGTGTYNLTNVSQIATLPGGPEGIAFVPPGSPLFTGFNMLVSEYSAGEVGVFALDANGNPILASRRDFITGLTGAEGAVIDPFTGDFLFSTFGGGDQVVVVRGFRPLIDPTQETVPEPVSLAVFGGLTAVGFAVRRRARTAA